MPDERSPITYESMLALAKDFPPPPNWERVALDLYFKLEMALLEKSTKSSEPTTAWRKMESAPQNARSEFHGPRILGIDAEGNQEICWWEVYNNLSEWVMHGGVTFWPVLWMPLPPPPKELKG